jgi:hypothetical protein
MATYQELEEKLARDLIDCMTPQTGMEPPLLQQVNTLINAIPFYSSDKWIKIHRGAMANLLATNLPITPISPHPKESSGGFHPKGASYTYDGPYPGYREAFWPGVTSSAAATSLAAYVKDVHSTLDAGWWSRYGVAILADAIREKVQLKLNTGKLDRDKDEFFNSLRPALSASYLSIFINGYAPTASALNVLSPLDRPMATLYLQTGIEAGKFTTNLNHMLEMGGADAKAVTWFLLNLWITLKSLGMPDLDHAINKFKAAGLLVPAIVGPVKWWKEGCDFWFDKLSGSDVEAMAATTIAAGFPEIKNAFDYKHPLGVKTKITTPYGYSYSFCHWGKLDWYK